uniref:Uncharacterized protein n=1 Tax=Rhizophora mucronata TaxID=61149 RepID=A0A2P2NI06_RHIMU
MVTSISKFLINFENLRFHLTPKKPLLLSSLDSLNTRIKQKKKRVLLPTHLHTDIHTHMGVSIIIYNPWHSL